MATLGGAMQRTNILRDIDEDLTPGRVYIPAPRSSASVPTPGAREDLLRDQIARADALYEEGLGAIRCSQRPRAMACHGPVREILRQIERDGYGRIPGRVAVPAWRTRLLIAEHRLGCTSPARFARVRS